MDEFEQEYIYDNDDFFRYNWAEKDWKMYLKKCEMQIALFLNLFISYRNRSRHLDFIAYQMGWIKDSQNDFSNSFKQLQIPVTILSHPVTIVTKALYHFLYKNFELYVVNTENVSAHESLIYMNLLRTGENNATLAISCINDENNLLSVCFFKKALKFLNKTIEFIDNKQRKSQLDFSLLQDAMIACFDLRTVWLAVIDSCRFNLDNEDTEDDYFEDNDNEDYDP